MEPIENKLVVGEAKVEFSYQDSKGPMFCIQFEAPKEWEDKEVVFIIKLKE
jgi:hypothetical protein